jgi:hypothetical protein
MQASLALLRGRVSAAAPVLELPLAVLAAATVFGAPPPPLGPFTTYVGLLYKCV